MTGTGQTGNDQPLVSCVMPTYNRREFVPHAIRYFLRQDYPSKELIVIDDGADAVSDLVPDLPGIRYFRLDSKITLGAKLNLACEYAKGNIIVNWDDDDWYAPWRLRYQVENMAGADTDVCGINRLLYLDLGSKNAFQYTYPSNQRVWLLGSSLCYTKARWKRGPFADIDVGMDGLFVWGTPDGRVKVLPDHSFSVHMIHRNNVSPKKTSGTWWRAHPAAEIKELMGDDWQYYSNGVLHHPAVSGYTLPQKSHRNVFACLVHEQPDCVADLVRNLHHHDPGSTILLYNGGSDRHLLPRSFPYDKYNAVVHDAPRPMQHGYLHQFALDCMQYALDNAGMDTLTIVDSDQLCIRKGYAAYIGAYLSAHGNVGMLSSNPRRVSRDDRGNYTALQAYREYDLWQPLLQQFPHGEHCFVHWTFWPSTVFTAAAARGLVKLFRENALLQNIMKQSRIWASEEVVLPTLVRLLGYDIGQNPCSYDLVRYRQPVRPQEATEAMRRDDIYWLHPVPRNMNDPLRKQVRGACNNYETGEAVTITPAVLPASFPMDTVLVKMAKIEGWLSNAEAQLLASSAIQALSQPGAALHIAEVGSYHGRSTVVLGNVAKELFAGCVLTSIDPHDGKLGAIDQGLKKYPPSYDFLVKNIGEAGLNGIVEIKKARATDVEWQTPISYLFIDGLHDYASVSADFHHFAGHLAPGAYVAFHDYIHYFPGVIKFVNELLAAGGFKKAGQAESLIVLQQL